MIDPLWTAATRWPDAPALVDRRGSRTWSRLLEDAGALAGTLGVAPGTRVALLADDTASAIVAIHAIRLAGGVLVPLHRRLALPELVDRLVMSRTRVLLQDPAHGEVAAVLAAQVTLERVLDITAPPVPGARSESTVLDLHSESAVLDLHAAGALVFTSGTTAVPRGVILSHGALLASAGAWDTFLASGPHDHWLSTLSMAHVAGLGMALRPLLSGACLTVHGRFDASDVRAALDRDGISLASLVPVQLARLLEAGPVPTGALRALLVGGGPVSADLVRRALAAGLPIVTTYGLTEAASGVTALPVAEAPVAPGSAGRPLPGVRVRVVDGQGRDAGIDVTGSIVVGGPTLAAGYDADPAATSASFREGWLHTRDTGRIDAAGRLWVMDRVDDLIVVGGENVSPVEVEGVLGMHPGVGDVAVVGRPDPAWGTVPVAALVPGQRRPVPTLDELRAFGRDHLAGYKLPRDLRIVTAIPRTPSGKIVRRAVRALLEGPVVVAHALPRSDGATIHLEDSGSGPTLVLLHATLSNAGELRGLAEQLADRFRVLSVDRRSSGASRMPPDDPGGGVDVAVHLEDLLGALDALAPGRPVLVVGHSFGGCVALELAARQPERVAGAWVFEPPYLAVLEDPHATQLADLGERVAALARDGGPGAAALAFLDAVRGQGTAARLPDSAWARLAAEDRAAAADAGLLGFDPDGLGRIVAPVVVALGGRSRGPYRAIADALSRRVATLEVERLDELGHGGPVSQPGPVAAAIVRFAERLRCIGMGEGTEASG